MHPFRILYITYHSDEGNTIEYTHSVCYIYSKIISNYLHFHTIEFGREELGIYQETGEKGTLPILFSNEAGLILFTMAKKTFLFSFEILNPGNYFGFQTKDLFKLLFKSETEATCEILKDENNILQIYHTHRVSPRKWRFSEKIEGTLGSDLMTVSQPGNPFSRLETNFSIELAFLQYIFTGSNSSLIYSPLHRPLKSPPSTIEIEDPSIKPANPGSKVPRVVTLS